MVSSIFTTGLQLNLIPLLTFFIVLHNFTEGQMQDSYILHGPLIILRQNNARGLLTRSSMPFLAFLLVYARLSGIRSSGALHLIIINLHLPESIASVSLANAYNLVLRMITSSCHKSAFFSTLNYNFLSKTCISFCDCGAVTRSIPPPCPLVLGRIY